MATLDLAVGESSRRVRRDRLELLAALISAPSFPPLLRDDIIDFPPDHSVYGWGCGVDGCERTIRYDNSRYCANHELEWNAADTAGMKRDEFESQAQPLIPETGIDIGRCVICPQQPAVQSETKLCFRHYQLWRRSGKTTGAAFKRWRKSQHQYPSDGSCRCLVCPEAAMSPLGLCEQHRQRYQRDDRPGNARLPYRWGEKFESQGMSVEVLYDAESAFKEWCRNADPIYRIGRLNLTGMAPLARAELKWGMHVHAQIRDRTNWNIFDLQLVANIIRRQQFLSMADLEANLTDELNLAASTLAKVAHVCRETIKALRVIYYSPDDSKVAGFIETDHFGRRFPDSASTWDLTRIPQRWLRDLLWEHLAESLRSEACPRTRGRFDSWRRGCVELGAFLEIDAPRGGHVPEKLTARSVERFVADQRNRERHGLPSLVTVGNDKKPSKVTTVTRRIVFQSVRQVMLRAMESGRAAQVGIDHGFVLAFPKAGYDPKRSRSPFTDEVAKALADEANLAEFAAIYDPNDRGLRDIWEIIIMTGRRVSEVLNLRLDCIGRYGSFPMLWHDQTKVGNYNEAIRIPEMLFSRIERRQAATKARFERKHGRLPEASERTAMALFPTHIRNTGDDRGVSYQFFSQCFRAWVRDLDLPSTVVHQARHTLATNLLRAGANLAQIRRYLGQVSDRMAEHYAQVSHSDLEDVLQSVWVAGPGSARPGELLSGSKLLTLEEAQALALDLSRRSTPTEGGFCTFQPVVNGAACPWKLDCENCANFVLSGADLLYWRRKQQQWRSISERAPDDATADYLHRVFEPTARAIAGLERALAALGLLDEALALDMRRPQDYFHRVWSINFRANDLAGVDDTQADRFSAETESAGTSESA